MNLQKLSAELIQLARSLHKTRRPAPVPRDGVPAWLGWDAWVNLPGNGAKHDN